MSLTVPVAPGVQAFGAHVFRQSPIDPGKHRANGLAPRGHGELEKGAVDGAKRARNPGIGFLQKHPPSNKSRLDIHRLLHLEADDDVRVFHGEASGQENTYVA